VRTSNPTQYIIPLSWYSLQFSSISAMLILTLRAVCTDAQKEAEAI
jgi:hypothetical protein